MVILRIRKRGIVQMCNALVCRASTSNIASPRGGRFGNIPFLKAVRAVTRAAFLMPFLAYAKNLTLCQDDKISGSPRHLNN